MDLISRQEVIKAIEDLPNCHNGFSDTYDKAYIIGVLEEMPSAEPERKNGKWILHEGYKGAKWYFGSVRSAMIGDGRLI